jgi:hypothetical protein
MDSKTKPLFSLGTAVATPPCLVALRKAGQSPDVFLNRHIVGDWGDDVDDHDAQVNKEAIWGDARIMSVYKTNCGEVLGFMSPCVIVQKSDGSKGSLEFSHSPASTSIFKPTDGSTGMDDISSDRPLAASVVALFSIQQLLLKNFQ